MCGFNGILSLDGNTINPERIAAMTAAITHRGPDDEGLYFSKNHAGANIGLGFRRLSIIDIAGGHQPMKLAKNVIVFNGEIYNYKELRKECETAGDVFTTNSDTEVLLRLYEKYRENCLEKLNGMFAFAIWDEEQRELFLCRDRLGIKPLYYFFNGKRLVFASEIKSLYRSREVPLEFDPVGVRDFFTYRFVPGPYTVLKNVRKVAPGHFVRVAGGKISECEYWSFKRRSPGYIPETSSLELENELYKLLEDSVRMQMVSDVSLGAFLSGGVDSSVVAALMARNSPKKIKTFSIGFGEDTGVDETVYARQVAAFLGTEHHEFILTKKDLNHASHVFSRMNEPVADPTILPTAILAGFARKEVKVVLTGEGGDELFAGYNRYKAVLYSNWIKKLPNALQTIAAGFMKLSGKGACFRAIPNVNAGNWYLLNRDFDPEAMRPLFNFDNGKNEWPSYLYPSVIYDPFLPLNDPLNDILELELKTSLTDRLLMKVDMATMSQSLEARPPYLDHRIVEFALSVPAEYKIRHFKGKYLLRKTAEKMLPYEICWRRKHGFIVPLVTWMRAISESSLESLLDSAVTSSLGIFNDKAVQKMKNMAKNNKGSIAMLWPAIVLTSWAKGLKE